MKKDDILKDLIEIFRDELDNQEINLDYKTTAEDIEEWDSLSHIQLIVSCEKFYKIKFNASEIISFKNVGDFSDSIAIKLS